MNIDSNHSRTNAPLLVPRERQYRLDWRAVRDYLQRQGHELNDAFEPRQFAAGAANLNFLIEVDGRKAVLRRPPDGSLPPGANDVKREYMVLSRLWSHYPYAPRAIHLCTDLGVMGVPFCISEYIEGATIGAVLPPSLIGIDDIGGLLARMTLEAMVKLHSIDPSTAGIQDIGRGKDFIGRQIRGWAKRGSLVLDKASNGTFDKIVDWLNGHVPAYQPTSIVHNDFKLDNLLIDLNSMELKGVVDWDMCTIGNPLYELAILLVYWGGEHDTQPYKNVARMPYMAPGWLSRKEAVDFYIARSPLTLDAFDLKFYAMLALFRLAVVYAQLLKVHSAGHIESAAFDEQQCEGAAANTVALLQECTRLIRGDLPWFS